MKQKFEEFVTLFKSADFTEWQEKTAREYLEIGDSKMWGGKNCGSDAEQEGSRFIAGKLEELGLDSVELVPVKTDRLQFNDATISFSDGSHADIKPYCATSAGTADGGITAKIVDCGMATKEEIDAQEVKGKIALVCNKLNITEANPFLIVSLLELQNRGAAAVCVWTDGAFDTDTNMAVMNTLAVEIPVVSVTASEGAALMRTNGEVKLTVDCEIIPEGGITYEVVGEIKGSESDEKIIYTAHLDHYHKCLQDNVSAVVTNLGIAKAMKELGYKPRRTITFIFNGSHEMGHVLSSSPDLQGPYMLFREARPDIPEKAIADINFEYTAMEQHQLRAFTSYETRSAYLDYVSNMPDECPGFEGIAKDVRNEDYFFLTWCDAVISVISGVPCYMNDAIGDQVYTLDSPYCGRDHSNKDDWSIYSADALRTNTLWYGSLAAFIDSRAFVEMDFANRMDMLAYSDDEKALLNEMEISTEAYDSARENVRAAGAELYERVKNANKNIKAIDENIIAVNRNILDVHKLIGEHTDNFMANMITTLFPKTKAYAGNLGMMCAAKGMLSEGKFDDAVGTLSAIDIAGLAYQFEGKYIDMCVDYIEGKNATWTKDRACRCFPMTDLMINLKKKGAGAADYSDSIRLLDMQIAELSGVLKDALATVAEGLEQAAEMIKECIGKVEKYR